jgi:hypothetical protein
VPEAAAIELDGQLVETGAISGFRDGCELEHW